MENTNLSQAFYLETIFRQEEWDEVDQMVKPSMMHVDISNRENICMRISGVVTIKIKHVRYFPIVIDRNNS